ALHDRDPRRGGCAQCFCPSRRRHTRSKRDWSSDVCSSDLGRSMNYLMTINGKSIGDNLEQFEVTNPGTNEVVGLMPKGAENEAHQAIQAAEGAFESWANLTAYDRANYLMKLNDLILENKEEMAKLMTLEVGKPITEYRGEVEYVA